MSEPVHSDVCIGHVHLQVADLQRATDFYHHVLGFDITMYGPDEASVNAAWLSGGGCHHYIAVNTLHSAGGTPPAQGHTGLYHFAIIYPNRRELAKAVKRVLEHGHTFTGLRTVARASQYSCVTRTATG